MESSHRGNVPPSVINTTNNDIGGAQEAMGEHATPGIPEAKESINHNNERQKSHESSDSLFERVQKHTLSDSQPNDHDDSHSHLHDRIESEQPLAESYIEAKRQRIIPHVHEHQASPHDTDNNELQIAVPLLQQGSSNIHEDITNNASNSPVLAHGRSTLFDQQQQQKDKNTLGLASSSIDIQLRNQTHSDNEQHVLDRTNEINNQIQLIGNASNDVEQHNSNQPIPEDRRTSPLRSPTNEALNDIANAIHDQSNVINNEVTSLKNH
ncbi:hypothetical protein NADFUDRAFT_82013, partial [Nadsonia fulvescens var. elongata DSM 6958]